MIRRWSFINELCYDFCLPFYYKKRFKFRMFRLNVRFRRFNLKKTKFKRKAFARLKHPTSWFIYLNVIKTWTQDFKFNKNYNRYQYSNNILESGVTIYDPNFFVFSKESYLYIFNGHISSITKKFYSYLRQTPFNFIKNINFTFAWFVGKFDKESNVVPLHASYNSVYYNPWATPIKTTFYKNLNFHFVIRVLIEVKLLLIKFMFYANFKRWMICF